MLQIYDLDWHAILVPETPLLEIVIRGTGTYLALFFLMRLVLKREAGAVGVNDLLVVVLIADAAQNAMAGSYRSVPDGILLVGVLVFWAWFLDWLGYHVPWVQRLIRPRPLLLVKDGEIRRDNMRRELITYDELMSQLRQQGVGDVREVREAFIEENGRISVITNDPATRTRARDLPAR